jgi:hypothetical protein
MLILYTYKDELYSFDILLYSLVILNSKIPYIYLFIHSLVFEYIRQKKTFHIMKGLIKFIVQNYFIVVTNLVSFDFKLEALFL